MPRLPRLATEIPADLADEARALVARIRAHPQPRELRRPAAELVVKLTEAGLAGYFQHPAERLGLGLMAATTVRVGLRTAAGGIAIAVRRLVDGMNDEQIVGLAGTIEEMLRDGAPAPGRGGSRR